MPTANEHLDRIKKFIRMDWDCPSHEEAMASLAAVREELGKLDKIRECGREGGRKGGKIGGKRCLETMTPEQRSARAKKAVEAREKKRADNPGTV